MRSSTIIMIAFAVVFGLLAVFVAQSWLNNQAALRMKSLEAQKRPIATRTIVVASRPLRFGTELSKQTVREIAWPDDALPSGSFSTIDELLNQGRRVVLTAIEQNEPILATKITGPGQRATLSAVIRDGFRAVTVRVNDVEGVGGFVLPGDRVDVMLTRQIDKGNATTDVVLQNTRVLAIDQLADERTDKPAVVKAVTLEVDTVGAQKLALASSIGTLSLMLRKAGEAGPAHTRRVTISDLTTTSAPVATERRGTKDTATVEVVRGVSRQEYSVPSENPRLRAVETVGEPEHLGN
ncbi:MAG TPA: Flp pilus assembly protein CpaB [Xanthobacteraceae bacterium]|nr:Flp pilus assembly protein CpaB [Xanthobacteraceae bacterium]